MRLLFLITPFLLFVNLTKEETQMNTDTKYKLVTGDEDLYRMKLLNEVYNPSSQSFLSKILENRSGNVLELGCGIGTMSAFLAEKTYPNKVLSTDICPDQIRTAKTLHQKENLTFETHDLKDILSSGKKFDLIYARFLFVHLNDLPHILALAKDALTPNGILVIDDIESAQSLTITDDKELHVDLMTLDKTQWKELHFKKHLCESLDALNFSILDSNEFHPELKTPTERNLLTLGIVSSKEPLVSANLLEEPFILNLIEKTKALETDTSKKVFYYKIYQVAVQKAQINT